MLIPNASRIFCGPAVVLGLLTGGAACAADMGYVLQNEHSRSVAIDRMAATVWALWVANCG